MSNRTFALVALLVAALLVAASTLVSNDYYFSAAYTVL